MDDQEAKQAIGAEISRGASTDEAIRLKAENERLAKRIAELERMISVQRQTGLPTHFRLELELEELIEAQRAEGGGAGFCILIVQLGESYAVVRKSFKSSVSEWVLYQTGCRISGLLRPCDRLFHTHEQEFVLILPGLKGKPLEGFLRSLIGRLGEPHIFSGFNVAIKAAIGGSYWPEHGLERSDVLHRADIAAGSAVEARRPFVLFKPELLARAVEKVELQASIIRAIESPALEAIGEQFLLYFQPKILASALDGDLLFVERVEAEALIRWNHPRKGLIGPATFIPLAEETGLILPLGKWLLYQCARKLATWDAEGREGVSLSVNLSARQFRSEDVVDVLRSALSGTKIDPKRITVELTETSLFEDIAAAERALQRFSELGVRVSVDDFGTGYSSLSHLHRFPLDEIKIDRLFVESLGAKRRDRIIVESLVSIARGLGLSLIAEGVETREALRTLWDMGCHGFQGFLLAKPMPAEEFLAYLARIEDDSMVIRLPEGR